MTQLIKFTEVVHKLSSQNTCFSYLLNEQDELLFLCIVYAVYSILLMYLTWCSISVVCRAVLPSTASPGGGWGSGL